MPGATEHGFYRAVKPPRPLNHRELAYLFRQVSQARVQQLTAAISAYIATNLPTTIRSKQKLSDYRINPYVMMTTSSTMRLEAPRDLANFLVNLKLYMGLETSFGKSIERVMIGNYPFGVESDSTRWAEPPEKIAEFAAIVGLREEARAIARSQSIWREIDASCVAGRRRHLVSIKSGPWTINDTQLTAMKDAIARNHLRWLQTSMQYEVDGIDIVIGLTYGTERATNNKEIQILVKLLGEGFQEVDRVNQPGVLANEDGSVRVYRRVGSGFWSYIGAPDNPSRAGFVFLEVLLSLAKALSEGTARATIEDALNERLEQLADAIRVLRFPHGSLPEWMREAFTPSELVWLAAALSSFYDSESVMREADELGDRADEGVEAT